MTEAGIFACRAMVDQAREAHMCMCIIIYLTHHVFMIQRIKLLQIYETFKNLQGV